MSHSHFRSSIYLLASTLIFICGIYPLALWLLGQTIFPFQAEGSLLRDQEGKIIGSRLIAQPFTNEAYFQPRPSAAFYNPSASASSSLAVSNYALRDRVSRTIGPIVTYGSGSKAGLSVGPDIEKWFAENKFNGKPHIVIQWARMHPSLAKAWVKADPSHRAYVHNWAKTHSMVVDPQPKAVNLAVAFFESLCQENPGKFPVSDGQQVRLTNVGPEIQSIFFDMWRSDNPDVDLQEIPGDYVFTCASGLDPHITLANAEFQTMRVATTWANRLNRNAIEVQKEINQILIEKALAPWCGLIGDKYINVLEVNLELNKHYGSLKK